MALKFSMILEAVDRATGPAKRIKSSMAGLTAGVRKAGAAVAGMSKDVDKGDRSLTRFQRIAARLKPAAIAGYFRSAGSATRQFGSNLAALERRLDLVGKLGYATGRGIRKGFSWMASKAFGLAKYGALAATGAGSFALFDLFKTAGKFEQYQVMLEGTEGSAAKAKKAMAWVQKFAQQTPYELDQVMEAFVQLKAYGIDPMDGSLMALGDGASGMSKDLMSAVEAMTGEYERLKEFGITTSVAGNKVTLTYRKAGKELKAVTTKGLATKEVLQKIFEDRFGGGMSRQATTLFGIVSNLKDAWSNFLLLVARAGIFDKVKAKLGQWQEKLAAMAADGRLQKWAKQISDALSDAFDRITKFLDNKDRWASLASTVSTVASAIVDVSKAIVAVANAAKFLDRATRGMNPTTGKPYEPLFQTKPKASAAPATSSKPWQGLFRLRSNFSPPAAPARAPLRRPASASGHAAQVNGKIALEVISRGPITTRVRSARSDTPGVALAVRTGKTMSAAA